MHLFVLGNGVVSSLRLFSVMELKFLVAYQKRSLNLVEATDSFLEEMYFRLTRNLDGMEIFEF